MNFIDTLLKRGTIGSRKMTQEMAITFQNGKYRLIADVAMTQAEWSLGLAGRDKVDGRGMVFLFPSAGIHMFNMGAMKYALDFVFLRNSRVVGKVVNVPHDHPGGVFIDENSDAVIEAPAGWAEGLPIGAHTDLPVRW